MRSFICLTLFFVFALTSQSATILVPSEQPTIQDGINAVTEGDTVLVASGTYTGDGNRDLTFNGVNMVLKSENGAEVTIIDCQGSDGDPHIGIVLDNGEDTTSIIDGFTFTNGYFQQWGFRGGALLFKKGTANILNCIISNSGILGIFLATDDYTNPCRISNCTVEGNDLGIYNGKIGTVIENCIVRDNLYSGIEFFMETEIKNCLIIHNGHVGVAHSPSIGLPPVLIDHCTIAFNGMGFLYDITPPYSSAELIEVDTGTVRNSIIAYNTNGGIFNNFFMEANYNCINSNVYGNGYYNWQNDKYAHGDQFGNLSVNPLFCDTTINNYTLGENSPCASVNNSSGSTIGVFDIGCGCCVGMRGNVNNDLNDQIDIGDLIEYVTCMFADCFAHCEDEMNVDGSPGINPVDIADIIYLVNYMFMGGPEPMPCNM